MTPARTVLLLGAAQYLAPSIVALRAAGFRTVTLDRDVSAPGHAFADAFAVASLSDAMEITKAARDVNASVIVPGTEAGVIAAAEASERLGLPTIGVELALRCTDKTAMRAAWQAAGLAQPMFRAVESPDALESALQDFGLPAVVKPARNGGSKGVSVVLSPDAIPFAVDDAVANSADGRFIVERFVPGPLLTADGFVRGDEVFVAIVGDVETQSSTRHRVNLALNYPAAYPPAVVAEARALITAAIRGLGLRTGAFHIECIVGDDGVVLVEVAARGGGSYLSSTIVGAVCGLSGPVTFAQLLLGDPVALRPLHERGAVLRFLQAPDGIVDEIDGLEQARALPGIVELDVALTPGSRGGPVAFDNARHGHVVAVGATRAEAVARADAAARTIAFRMRDQRPASVS
ncbi:MAG: ATP-grasp domain-containing protein [Candidatus Eremiobacteraeota bacterium]|nr:ATP-grasp domain-containing protein [Candidatus Eremiobacteraeota bacterium]